MASGDSDKISMKISLEHALKELAEEHERKESDRRAVYLNVYDMVSASSHRVLGSIVVSISACHAEDPGSIPGRGVLFLFNSYF